MTESAGISRSRAHQPKNTDKLARDWGVDFSERPTDSHDSKHRAISRSVTVPRSDPLPSLYLRQATARGLDGSKICRMLLSTLPRLPITPGRKPAVTIPTTVQLPARSNQAAKVPQAVDSTGSLPVTYRPPRATPRQRPDATVAPGYCATRLLPLFRVMT